MSQISPPMRILLVGAVVLAAAWVLFLKPGGSTDTATPAATPAATPGLASTANGPKAKTGLGRAVQAAHGASDKSDAANAATGGETSKPATSAVKPSTSAATAPKPATTTPATGAKAADPLLAKLPKWLQKDLDHKVVALLFVDRKAADDRRTADALKGAYRANGKVVTRTVPVSEISRYGPVARGVDVGQSPTLMVIDRDSHADSLVGYSNRDTINQAIIDGLLATDNPATKVGYLKRMQSRCRTIGNRASLHPYTVATPKELKASAAANLSALTAAQAALAPRRAPGAYKPLGRQMHKYLASEIAVTKKIKASGVRGKSVDSIAVNKSQASNDKLQADTLLELNAVGVSACN